MKKIFILIISVLSYSNITAQELESYNGKFKGGYANYQYKTAPDGSRIYHGAFEFTKEFALDSRSYTFSIKGSYKNDLKHGRWIYSEIPTPNKRMSEDDYKKRVTIPEFVNEYGKVYASMERLIHSRISLTIDYIEGKMEGDYIHAIYTPPINNYKETKDIFHLKMKNNHVVSNYTSTQNDNYVANIEFDDYGFPHGEWTYRDKSSEDIIDYIYIFNHGIAMKEIIRNESTGDTSQKNYEMNNESTQEYNDYLENNSQIFYLKTYEAPITIKNKLFSFILLRIYDDLFRYSIRTSDFKGEYPFEGFPYRISSTISSHPGLSGTRKDILPIEERPIEEKPFVTVEQMPTFPGGEINMHKFIGDNLRYPEDAQKAGIQGRVTIRFVVSKTGAISNATVIRGIDPSCDKEAVRVVKSMPEWIPGKQNGKNVPVYFTLPIIFRLK